MEREEAQRLFMRYRDLLDRSFFDKETIRSVKTECFRILQELRESGFKIFNRPVVGLVDEPEEDGQKRSVIIHYHDLVLVIGNDVSEELFKSRAVSKIYGGEHAESEEKQDVESLIAEAKPLPTIRETLINQWQRDWIFLDEERHVLEAALVRHWEKLSIFAGERMLDLESLNFYLSVIRTASYVAPTPEDAFVFNFYTAHEQRFLTNSTEMDFFEECGCTIEGHLKAIEGWQKRNLH